MEKKYAAGGKAKAFIKKNMYYIIIGACIIAIGAMIAVALLVKDTDASTGEPLTETPVITEPDIDNTPTGSEDPVVNDPVQEDPTPVVQPDPPAPIVFTSPVVNGTVSKDYTMSTVVYWSTLKHYAVHNGIDLTGTEGAAVVAALDGKVLSVSYDALNGNVVKIEHDNGLVTTYGSIDNVVVSEGQTVKAGDSLGIISTTATNEMSDGAHVHFCTYLNGDSVDPLDYLPVAEK